MASVVFLRAVNVGTANRCRPAQIAKQLKKFDVVNIGAVGTFVVRENVGESVLRAAIEKELGFKCEIIIVPGRDVLQLAAEDPFTRQPCSPDIIRFVNVLAKRLSKPPCVPLTFPKTGEWGVKIIGIQGRFVLGVYLRNMRAIGYLGKV